MERKLNSAFTLLEVVLVIMILAIVLAIAIPNFSRYITDYNISEQIEKLYSDINYAKFYSTTHQVPVNINIGQNQTEISTNQTNSTVITQYSFSYSMSCSSNPIALNAFGIAQGNASCSVTQNNDANPNCIVIEFSKISTGRWINGSCQK